MHGEWQFLYGVLHVRYKPSAFLKKRMVCDKAKN